MSRRRHAGEWVRLPPGVGFIGESDRLPAQIQPEPDGDWSPCPGLCDDPECREWATLWTESDPLSDGRRHTLCHVSECVMEDCAPTEGPK